MGLLLGYFVERVLFPLLEVSPFSAAPNSPLESLPSLFLSYFEKSFSCSLPFASSREMEPSLFLSSLRNSWLVSSFVAPALELPAEALSPAAYAGSANAKAAATAAVMIVLDVIMASCGVKIRTTGKKYALIRCAGCGR